MMRRTGVFGWLQIDSIEQDFSPTSTSKIFNASSSPLYNSTDNSSDHYQLLIKAEAEDARLSPLSQLNALITCGLILVVTLHGVIGQSQKAGVSGVFALSCLAMTAILGPVVGSILLALACYRQCVLAILRATCKKGTFAGLMRGNDAFWALEEHTARSVINVLALADFTFIVDASNNCEEPLRTVQELIEDRLLSRPQLFPKLLCYRKHYLGYYYWERQPYLDVTEHVRWMKIDPEAYRPDGAGFIPEGVLRNYVSALSNAPLPAEHSSGWEILIGRRPVVMDTDALDMMESGGTGYSTTKYPVLFRIHHSLGDGVALVRLLLDALADPCTRTPSRTPSPSYDYPEHFYKSPYLGVPCTVDKNTTFMKKSVSYSFEDWNNYYDKNYNTDSITPSTGLGDCVRAACRKFINLVEETSRLNRLQCQTQSLQNINIVINDVPEFSRDNANNVFSIISDTKPMGGAAGQRVTSEDRKKFDRLFIDADDGIDNYFNQDSNTLYKIVVDFIKNKYKSVKNILYHLAILSLLPATVMNQVVTRTYDENALHGPKLSGYKVVGWHMEDTDDEEKRLMSVIKRIRARTGAHFSDVVFTALSNSLEDFFKRFNQVPDVMTAVIPARIGRPDRHLDYNAKVSTATFKLKELNAKITKLHLDRNAKRNHSVLYESSETGLDNKFSVALLTIPVASRQASDESDANVPGGPFTKLRHVQKCTDGLRKSADYLVNYWILNVVATFFPIPILRNLVKSTQSSLVVSNMPGPQNVAKLAGHSLQNIVFWVPNRDTTGVGITILSYNGRLQFGIMADRALIPCWEDAQLIVDGVVDGIKRMDRLSSATAATD